MIQLNRVWRWPHKLVWVEARMDHPSEVGRLPQLSWVSQHRRSWEYAATRQWQWSPGPLRRLPGTIGITPYPRPTTRLWLAAQDTLPSTVLKEEDGDTDSSDPTWHFLRTYQDGDSVFIIFLFICQGSQPASTKDPYSRCHDVIKKHFYIWQYRSAMNSWELPYYYHTFLVVQHRKLTQFIFGILRNKLLTYGIILPREMG